VRLHLAYRWFCRLDLNDAVPHHSTFSENRLNRFRESNILDRTQERFDLKPKWLAADTAFGTGKFLGWMVKTKKIIPHIPVSEKSRRQDGIFSRSDFRWDSKRDCDVCVQSLKTLVLGRHQHDGARHSPEVPSLIEVELYRVLFNASRPTQLEHNRPARRQPKKPDFSTASVRVRRAKRVLHWPSFIRCSPVSGPRACRGHRCEEFIYLRQDGRNRLVFSVARSASDVHGNS
jgi:hypothetical protein